MVHKIAVYDVSSHKFSVVRENHQSGSTAVSRSRHYVSRLLTYPLLRLFTVQTDPAMDADLRNWVNLNRDHPISHLFEIFS
jgi:hypothetical protein